MRQNEIKLLGGDEDGKYYTNVGLFRIDVYHATPIENINKSKFTAVVPSFGSYGGSNDRLFYGTYENARLWADRFGFSEEFETKYIKTRGPKQSNKRQNNGYHSEYYLGKLMEHFKMDVERSDDICLWRIRAEGRLSIGDCMYLSKALEIVPNGFYLEKEGVKKGKHMACHWSKIWDKDKNSVVGDMMLNLFDIGSNR